MSTRNKILSAVIALLVTLTIVAGIMPVSIGIAQTDAKTYYVSPTGDDSNDGLSDTTPFKSIFNASQLLNPGDTLIVGGGTYTNDAVWPLKSGTEQEPITIKAKDGETPVITGTGVYGNIIHLSATTQYVTVDGINTLNTNCTPVVMNNSKNVKLENCSFRNNNTSTGSFMVLYVTANATIENCLLDTTGGQIKAPGDGEGEGIYVNGGNHNLIQNNHFIKNGHYSADFKDNNDAGATTSYNNVFRGNLIEQYWGGGVGAIFGAHNNLIEGNTIYYAGAECEYPKTGIQLAADNNIIRNNIIGWASDGSRGGYTANSISLLSYPLNDMNQNCTGNRIYNNISYKAGKAAVLISERQDTKVTNNKILNNIFYNNSVAASGAVYLSFDTGGSIENSQWTTDFPRNNYFYNNMWKDDSSADVNVYFDGGKSTINSFTKSVTQMNSAYPSYFYGNTEESPMFVDPDNGDFRLSAGSPAIDAGANLAVTTQAGTDTTTVPVDDALFFTDGYGIVNGDSIIVEGNQPVTVTGVDYTNNTLTVSSPVTFEINASVNITFSGSAPDLGVAEYDASSTPMPVRGTLLPITTPTPVPSATPVQSATTQPTPTPVATLAPFEKQYNFGTARQGDQPNYYTYNDGTSKVIEGVKTIPWKVHPTNNNIYTDNGSDDAYVAYKFQGTAIKLYGEVGSFCGIGEITIFDENNNVEVGPVYYDAFSLTHYASTLLYTSPALPDGIHTMKVRVTATYNPANIQGFWTINLTKVGIISPLNTTPTPKPTPTLKPTPTPVPTPQVTFPDVSAANLSWAVNEIQTLATQGIIKGTTDGNGKIIYDPYAQVTRAQLTKLIVESFQIDGSGSDATFSDVPSTAWYYDYVGKAYKNKIINGTSADTFGPDSPITRQDMACIIIRAMVKYKQISLAADESYLSIFADKDSIADYAKINVATAVNLGIIKGSNQGNDVIFAPKDNTNRAQAAVVVYRMLYNK